MHLLEAGSHKILLDCGLHQGRREEARQRNAHFPFHPHQIDAVVLSHAHIDHCGNLPTLVRQGFDGPIYCTPPTRDLLRVMLADSAKIQEEDAAHLNIARNYAEPWVQPLYTRTDVEQMLRQCVRCRYGEDTWTSARRCSSGSSRPGTSSARRWSIVGPPRPAATAPLTFSGDLGRRDLPILKPTAPIPPADVLVCESTYGNRLHRRSPRRSRSSTPRSAARSERGGKVLIPAFSLGRTQLIIHVLQQGPATGEDPARADLRR